MAFWLVEKEEQINYLINKNYNEVFVEIIPYHNAIHPALNDVSLVYIRPSNESKGYMLCVDHSETLSINKTIINDLLTNIKMVWVRDKKSALYYFPIKCLYDLSILNPPYTQDQTQTHTYFQNKYPNYDKINKIIPVSKHYEVCENIYNKVKPHFKQDLPPYFDFYNNKTTIAFFGIEKNGIKIDEEQFYKHFKPNNPLYSIKDGRIYTHYNLGTTTRRPSNAFNGINFAALNKENGARGSFISSHGFMEFDISAYHPHIVSRLISYDFDNVDIHQTFADLYGTSYKEAKELTFKQLYGGVFKEYSHLEFFQKITKFIENNWKEFNNSGQVITPVSGYCFKKSEMVDMNPQKLFNYMLQCIETSINTLILLKIHKLLRGKNTKIVLYTYDSFLFQMGENEDYLIKEIKQIFDYYGFSVKSKKGINYDNMEIFTI
jgi:hypothetical protein